MDVRAFVGVPLNGRVEMETAETVLRFLSKHEGWFDFGYSNSSSPAQNFNELWRIALNQRKERHYTHYFMIHHDVVRASPWCLDTIVMEMFEHDADYCSVPIPIKGPTSLTSTGILDMAAKVVHRLTVYELDKRPETFTAAPGQHIMANTGMFACRFDRPWVNRVWFENRDRILYITKDGQTLAQHEAADLEDANKLPDGEWRAANWTEDWNLSLMMAQLGLKVIITRKVQLEHRGTWQWPNYLTDGEWMPRKEWKTEQQPIDARWILDLHRKEQQHEHP
jgi:hypothetical protein